MVDFQATQDPPTQLKIAWIRDAFHVLVCRNQECLDAPHKDLMIPC